MAILVGCYVLIVVLVLILITLCLLTAYDFYKYFKGREDFYAVKCCSSFFQEEDYMKYEKCYNEAIEEFRAANGK